MTLPFKLKSILRQKKKNYENSNISPCIILKKKSSIYYYNCITNLKFQHKPNYHLSKNPHIKLDLLLPQGQNPLKLLYSINESKQMLLGLTIQQVLHMVVENHKNFENLLLSEKKWSHDTNKLVT